MPFLGGALTRTLHGFQDATDVLISDENGFAPVAAILVMAGRPRIWNAHFSSHGRTLILRRQRSQLKSDGLD